ncbi:Transducin/WD40 repeat-like superfamily protein [Raphanus sativus]|nr:Transducin/WD40 repeat-like superfamily protein [Raphanus sativus]
MKLSQKLKKPSSPAKLILQEIIGLTTNNANGLASLSCSSKCVYLAGCVVVVYDVDACTQSHLLVSHRTPKTLSCVAVSHNGRFVAAGERTRSSKVGSLAFHGKPTDGGFQKGNSFVSVISANRVSSSGSDERGEEVMSIYALTDAGVLMLMSCDMLIKKSVDLKVEKCFALSASSRLIACACSEGAIQLFTPETLEYSATIHFSDARKSDNENHSHSEELKNIESQPVIYPDAVACQFSTTDKLVVIYGDHSLYVWDVNDVNKPTRCSMMISHSAGIRDIKNLSCGNMHNPTAACVARGCCEGVSFTTCSEDGTIRLWDLDLQMNLLEANASSNASESETKGTMHLASAGIFERDLVETCGTTFGFRALAVSEDGKYLAAGDCGGNLHIYDLQESEYTCFTDAHEAEIQSLSFSVTGLKDLNCENASSSEFLLASGGKGGAIHVYDVKRNFDPVGSVCGSAAVKSVKFACNGRKILTSGADRLQLFDVVRKESHVRISPSKSQTHSHGTIHDMAVDPTSGLVVTVGQDKKINIFDTESGKLVRSFKQNREHGDAIKVILDPSCSYLACSYSDRTICLLDFVTGELVAQATGHGEAVTGVIFLPDCKHIISVAGDGCIFVWKLPLQMATRMIQAVNENVSLAPVTVAQPVTFVQIVGYVEEDNTNADQMQQLSPWASSFKFSVSRLPKWAQAKVETNGTTDCKESISNQLKAFSSDIGLSSLPPQQKLDDKSLVNAVDIAEECSSSKLECQTPKQGSRTGKSCLGSLSKSSSDSEASVPQGDAPSHRKETRWNTIYNVCLDLLNSPNIQTSFIKQQKAETFCSKPSAEQGDMFKQFDNSLSMVDEVGADKTSQQRRYSTQFVLTKDYIGGTRQSLRTPSQKSGYKTLRSIQEHLPLDTVNDQSSQSSEEHPEQDKASSEVFHDTLADDSLQERITSCRQALNGLEAAASVFVQSMSELSTASPRDRISGELRAQLFDEAALMIPGMSQKLSEVVATMMLERKSRTQSDG